MTAERRTVSSKKRAGKSRRGTRRSSVTEAVAPKETQWSLYKQLPQGSELFFCIMIIAILVASWYIHANRGNFHEQCSPIVDGKTAAGGDYPEIQDYMIMVYATGVLSMYRIGMTYLLWPLAKLLLKKEKYKTDVAFYMGINKTVTSIVKGSFFVGSSIFGYMIMRDQSFFLPQLFGSGDWSGVHEGWPCEQQFAPYTRYYYMISMAYHVHSLIFHMFQRGRNDYFEMLAHHICAFMLVGLSYEMNMIRIGMLVMFVHDIPDIFIYSTKVTVDMKYGLVPTIFTYGFGMLIVFAYLRLYVLPVMIANIIMMPSPSADFEFISDTSKYWYAMLLTVLVFLHCFWYRLFLRMGYNLLTKKKAEDIQEHVNEFKESKAALVAEAEARDTDVEGLLGASDVASSSSSSISSMDSTMSSRPPSRPMSPRASNGVAVQNSFSNSSSSISSMKQ